MSNHWHFAVWPHADGQVTNVFRWLAHTHAMRWRVAHRTVGYGPLYQGRFKSFPVQRDKHLLTVVRYIERNPVDAGIVARTEVRGRETRAQLGAGAGSGDPRTTGGSGRGPTDADAIRSIGSHWPVARPADWRDRVNAPLSAQELRHLRAGLTRGRPFGAEEWVNDTARAPRLEHTLRPEGRPPQPRT